jgi:UDP-N-acetylmuramate--alanine ligase
MNGLASALFGVLVLMLLGAALSYVLQLPRFAIRGVTVVGDVSHYNAISLRAMNVRAVDGQMYFTVQRRNGLVLPDLEVVLNLPGRHNVLNALSAIAVAVELGIDDAAVLRALAHFKGVGRRFQRYGELPVSAAHGGGIFTLVDDYGHHPVEMAATLAAARGAFPGRRLLLAFQPHRFTRTRDCFDNFVKVIAQADAVLLTEVYAAGETPIVAADGRSLARALRVAGHIEPVFVDDVGELPQAIVDAVRDGDVVLCMGAGSIGAVPAKVVGLLQSQAFVAGERKSV